MGIICYDRDELLGGMRGACRIVVACDCFITSVQGYFVAQRRKGCLGVRARHFFSFAFQCDMKKRRWQA